MEEPAPSGTPDSLSEAPRLYSAVTRHWPRIAAALVVFLGIAELALGGLTADSSIELYLTAWAALTGGLWYLAEKAERSLAPARRPIVAAWLTQGRLGEAVGSIPGQFALFFDKVFGERHFSRHCFNRSCVASLYSVMVVTVFAWLFSSASDGPRIGLVVGTVVVMAVPAVLFNFLPDYLSLLETRWAIRWMERTGHMGRVLVVDTLATTILSAGGIIGAMIFVAVLFNVTELLAGPFRPAELAPVPVEWSWIGSIPGDALRALVVGESDGSNPISLSGPMIRICFASAFFTSLWLWLYAVSVVLGHALIRMGGGVGFLLRLADVEAQPFRSIGFVTVVVVSCLFALGLPFVFLL